MALDIGRSISEIDNKVKAFDKTLRAAGDSIIKPTRFISKAIKRLKGMDERIAIKFTAKLEKFDK